VSPTRSRPKSLVLFDLARSPKGGQRQRLLSRISKQESTVFVGALLVIAQVVFQRVNGNADRSKMFG
jgi:hypothetical protein